MTEIYNYIPLHNILQVDDYNQVEKVHHFTKVKFRIQKCDNFYNFHAPLALYNDKVISISNKQFSFLNEKYHHFVGDQLASVIKDTYVNLQTPTCQIVTDPVFQFVDYESIGSTSHVYDLMFHLLYIFKKYNIEAKLLVCKSDNIHYNNLLELIKKYFNVNYFYVDLNTNYIFDIFYCSRTYQNILFHEVKDFINRELIDKVMVKYEGEKYYNTLSKLKYCDINNMNRLNNSFIKSEVFNNFLHNKNICDLNNINEEDYKIYLLNKSSNIIVSCTSPYDINICYYIKDILSKNINIIYHKSEDNYLWKFTINGDTIKQNIPSILCGNIINQQYNTIHFKGKLLSGITCPDEIIDKVSLI